MKKFPLYLVALLCMAFVSCGGDDDDNGSGGSGGSGGGGGNPTTETTNTNANTGRAEFLRKELPNLKSDPLENNGDKTQILIRSTSEGINYIIKWDVTRTAQIWTAYIHTAMTKKNVWNRNNWDKDPFQPDPDLGTNSSTLAQYANDWADPYDRGHICAQAERMYSKDANEQTFYLSNMHPQKNGFNAGIWLEMENKIQTTKAATEKDTWNTDSFRDTLWVCKGGTITDGQIRGYTNGLPVPAYFFMAIIKVKDGVYSGMAFYVKHDENIPTTNDDSDVKKYAMSIDELEKKTGIDFFCNFPDKLEESIESKYTESAWFK